MSAVTSLVGDCKNLPAEPKIYCLQRLDSSTTIKGLSKLPATLTKKHASSFCLQPVNTGPRGQEQDTPIFPPTQIRRQLW